MNKQLRFLYLSNALLVFAGNLFTPLYALFVLDIGGKAALAGILFGVQFMAMSITSMLIIRLNDKSQVDYKLLHVGFLLRAFVWGVLGFIQDIPTLLFVQVIGGVADAIATPAFETLVSEHLDTQRHIREWGIWELVKNPIIALASVLSGFIITYFGFSTLFFLMAFCAASASLVLQTQRESR